MDIKKIVIAAVIIGGAYWLYKRSKATPTTTTGTSNATGAQLLAVAKGAKVPQFRCNCGAIVSGPAGCADACAGVR